jgi:hypothetical protein
MIKSKNLRDARKNKNDEFYTQLTDIEKELRHYKIHFKDKVVFCNCDDPEESNFWKFFSLKFEDLGLKRLVSTHFEKDKPSYKLEIVRDINGDGKINKLDTIRTPLVQCGDFRSEECIEILKECDIVVTNPPFSLFREFLAQIMKYKKKFLVIGNQNAITYKETFKLIQKNKVWLGTTNPKVFVKPDKTTQAFGNICWFTNLPHNKRNEKMILFRKYYGNEKEYPKYDNYDAIEVSKTIDIPCDFEGIMGVPITFLDKYSPKQFKIVGNEYSLNISKGRFYVNGKRMYSRIIIQNKKPQKGVTK